MLRRRRFSPNGRGSDALTGLFERRGGVGFPQRRSGGAALRAWVQTLRRRFFRNGDRGFDAQGSPKRRSGGVAQGSPKRRSFSSRKTPPKRVRDASRTRRDFRRYFFFVAFAPFLGRSFSGDFFTADAQQKPANRFADFKRRDATREKSPGGAFVELAAIFCCFSDVAFGFSFGAGVFGRRFFVVDVDRGTPNRGARAKRQGFPDVQSGRTRTATTTQKRMRELWERNGEAQNRERSKRGGLKAGERGRARRRSTRENADGRGDAQHGRTRAGAATQNRTRELWERNGEA